VTSSLQSGAVNRNDVESSTPEVGDEEMYPPVGGVFTTTSSLAYATALEEPLMYADSLKEYVLPAMKYAAEGEIARGNDTFAFVSADEKVFRRTVSAPPSVASKSVSEAEEVRFHTAVIVSLPVTYPFTTTLV
jgi:hypothetical protein